MKLRIAVVLGARVVTACSSRTSGVRTSNACKKGLYNRNGCQCVTATGDVYFFEYVDLLFNIVHNFFCVFCASVVFDVEIKWTGQRSGHWNSDLLLKQTRL